MSDLTRDYCKTTIEKHYLDFLKKRNVVGLAFGHKIVKNLSTNQPCLVIFVSTKESEASLNENDLIPKTYNGIVTDVIETGELSHHSLIEKRLPLEFGYSIGSGNFKGAGTASCLVTDKCGNYYILSNNHVLSNYNQLPLGTPVLYPAVRDGGSYPDDLIAILHRVIPLLFSSEFDGIQYFNYVDCAIAKVINPSLVSKKIALIDCVKGVADAKLNLKVKKVGRTTQLTTGTITQLDALVKITVPNKGDILYKNQIVTTSMDENGDSGSLVLDENNNAIGLLFGGSESTTFVNPIKSVLTALNVRIVTC